MEYRLDKNRLLNTLSVWDGHLNKGEIDMGHLKDRFHETSSYDVSDEKNRRNFQHFLGVLKKEGFEI
ncbi:MAG: hypothetical protein HQ593_06570 [Candidatus Omnitrophica bacterium]|nr:hypothetical protein [Candidatus Omnitrophota bacterium]